MDLGCPMNKTNVMNPQSGSRTITNCVQPALTTKIFSKSGDEGESKIFEMNSPIVAAEYILIHYDPKSYKT